MIHSGRLIFFLLLLSSPSGDAFRIHHKKRGRSSQKTAVGIGRELEKDGGPETHSNSGSLRPGEDNGPEAHSDSGQILVDISSPRDNVESKSSTQHSADRVDNASGDRQPIAARVLSEGNDSSQRNLDNTSETLPLLQLNESVLRNWTVLRSENETDSTGRSSQISGLAHVRSVDFAVSAQDRIDEEVSKIANIGKQRQRELVIFDLDDTLIFTFAIRFLQYLDGKKRKQRKLSKPEQNAKGHWENRLQQSEPLARNLLVYAVEKYKGGNAIVAIVTNGGPGWVKQAFETYYGYSQLGRILEQIIVLSTHEVIKIKSIPDHDQWKPRAYPILKSKLDELPTDGGPGTPWNVIAFGDNPVDIKAAQSTFGQDQVFGVKFADFPRDGHTDLKDEEANFFDWQLEQALTTLRMLEREPAPGDAVDMEKMWEEANAEPAEAERALKDAKAEPAKAEPAKAEPAKASKSAKAPCFPLFRLFSRR